jgi:hypothetical protein
MVVDALPPLMASLFEGSRDRVAERELIQIPQSTVWPRLAKEDWLGALGVFLLVFLSQSPVVVPFIFISNARLALRISNVVAPVTVLAGCSFGRFTNSKPREWGFPWSFLGSR